MFWQDIVVNWLCCFYTCRKNVQWMADNVLCDFNSGNVESGCVAVIVPRRAIAEGLAKFVSEMRCCKVCRLAYIFLAAGIDLACVAGVSDAPLLIFAFALTRIVRTWSRWGTRWVLARASACACRIRPA
jgi:hypothetical protein